MCCGSAEKVGSSICGRTVVEQSSEAGAEEVAGEWTSPT